MARVGARLEEETGEWTVRPQGAPAMPRPPPAGLASPRSSWSGEGSVERAMFVQGLFA